MICNEQVYVYVCVKRVTWSCLESPRLWDLYTSTRDQTVDYTKKTSIVDVDVEDIHPCGNYPWTTHEGREPSPQVINPLNPCLSDCCLLSSLFMYEYVYRNLVNTWVTTPVCGVIYDAAVLCLCLAVCYACDALCKAFTLSAVSWAIYRPLLVTRALSGQMFLDLDFLHALHLIACQIPYMCI